MCTGQGLSTWQRALGFISPGNHLPCSLVLCNAISPYQLHSCFPPNPDHFYSFSKAPSSHNQERQEISLFLSPSLVDDGHEHNQTVCVHLSLNYSCPFPSQHKHPFISCCCINRQTADDCCESDRKYQSPLRLKITVLGGWDIRSSYRKTPPRLLQWTSSAMWISAGGAKCKCWHVSQWPRISRGHKYLVQAN